MSRQEKKMRAEAKMNAIKKKLVRFIGSPKLFSLMKKKLIDSNPQEKCLVERACVELKLAQS